LEKFARLDARKAELVKHRYFVGLNFEETAAALGIALPTSQAVVGLCQRLAPGGDGGREQSTKLQPEPHGAV
jgi:hypothetical protein